MIESCLRPVRVDELGTGLPAGQSESMVAEMLALLREAVVNYFEGRACAATYLFEQQVIELASHGTLSEEDVESVASLILKKAKSVSEHFQQEVVEPREPLTVRIRPEKLKSKHRKIVSQTTHVVRYRNRSVGVLYLGSLKKGLALKSDEIAEFLEHDFSTALGSLIASNERQREIFNLIAKKIFDGVILCDAEKRVVFINAAARRLLRISGEKRAVVFISDLNVAFLQDFIEEASKKGINEINKVVNAPHKRSQLLGVHTERLWTTKNADIGWLTVLRDVTKNWQNDQLKSALTVASHEIKTPLSSIQGAVELLLEQDLGELNVKQVCCLGVIKDDIKRLHRLLADILDLSRFEEGIQFLDRRKEISLVFLVTKVMDCFRHVAESKGITLQNRIPKTIPTFQGDRDRLQQVIANLVDNGIKYSLSGGSIEIGAELEEKCLTFWVSDEGVGIAADHTETIFEKFKRLDNSPEGESKPGGYGLGLSIAKEIVEAIGGKIWLESEVGVGSKFYVSLQV